MSVPVWREMPNFTSLTQWVISDEGVKRSFLPDNLLTRGGENFGERSGFFIVERHAAMHVSKSSPVRYRAVTP